MSETTTTAAKTAEKTIKAVSELPFVAETAELALLVPAKVVLNQKLVVSVSLLAGAGIGAGVLWSVNKWRNRKSDTVPDTIENNETIKG